MKASMAWLRNVWGRRPREAERLAKAYKTLLTSEEGWLILQDLALYANLYNSSFCAGDPAQTAFNEGQRELFLHITSMAQLNQADLLRFLTTLKENKDSYE